MKLLRIGERDVIRLIKEEVKRCLKEGFQNFDDPNYVPFKIAYGGKPKEIRGEKFFPWYVNFPMNGRKILDIKAKLGKYLGLYYWDDQISVEIFKPLYILDANGNVDYTNKEIIRLQKIVNAIDPNNPSKVEEIATTLYRKVRERVDKKAMAEANKSYDQLWDELMEKLGDDTVQEMMKMLSIKPVNGSVVDHQLSYGNKLRALAQAQKYGVSITYLATENQWNKMGRRVKANAKRYFLYYGTGEEDKNATKQTLSGIESGGFKASYQQERAAKLANSKFGGNTGMYVAYDYADTDLASQEDKFNNVIGFEDNLQGIPNAYTQGRLGTDDEHSELYKKIYGTSPDSEYKRYWKACQAVAQEMGTTISTPQSDDDNVYRKCVAQMVHGMVKEMIKSKMRVLKQDSDDFKKLSMAGLMMTMLMLHIPPSGSMGNIKTDPVYWKGLRGVCISIASSIKDQYQNFMNESVLREGFEDENLDELFKEAFRQVMGVEYDEYV